VELSAAGTLSAASLGISGGQGWVQFGELMTAFALSALIGLERELRQKAAGLRTHTLVGVASALIMLVSKYGFSDVLVPGHIILDPSRVAAQVVSGVGFIGAGLIFVRRDAVRGLTTAAVVWLVAAIGLACGGGLPGLALAVTALYFVALYAFPAIIRRMPRIGVGAATLRLDYEDGRGVLRRVLEICTSQHFRIGELSITGERSDGHEAPPQLVGQPVMAGGVLAGQGEHPRRAMVSVLLVLHGRGSIADLAARLQELDGVLTVHADTDAFS
jgi:putative Mg2+ transporter-C (MgtC) family protein